MGSLSPLLRTRDLKHEHRGNQAFVYQNCWNIAIEHVEPARANSTCWYMWKLPLAGEWNIDTIMNEFNACKNANPNHHVKVIGYDGQRQTQGLAMVVFRAAA